MRGVARIAGLLILVGAGAAGCGQNPFVASRQNSVWQRQQQQLAQRDEMERRALDLDTNNRDLHAQIAQAQQQVQLQREEISLLKKRLTQTSDSLADSRAAEQEAEAKIARMESSVRRRGGAIITANNSLRESLSTIDIADLEVRLDGDVVRIELPADKLFMPRTATLHQGAFPLLDEAAAAIARNYPRQMIGIEGHSDSDPVAGTQWRSHHQLTAAQAMAVYDQLSSRGRIPARQLHVMGHGANHPVVSNGTLKGKARNRRVELVIYPETFDET